jgi:Putative beta-barrel porin-2, OmpL-like. bbp2
MRARAGLCGLERWIGGCVAILLVAGTTARAADGPSAGAGQTSTTQTSAPIAASLTASAAADDTASPKTEDQAAPAPDFLHSIDIYGFVDGYYLWNFNKVDPVLRNFDVNHNTFSLNYVELAIAKTATEQSRAGFRVDFGAGDTADMVNAFEPGGSDYLKHVQQAYVSFLAPVGKGLTVDFGKFVTPAGAEVIETKDNWNYSRGILFAWAIPYYHMGARVGYAVNDKVSLTGYLMNGWNNVKENNDDKTGAISVTVKPNAKLTWIGNYIVGKEQAEDADGGTRQLFDTVATYAATDKVSVLGNFDYGRDKSSGADVDWYGVAVGLKYQANDKWSVSPRYEIFKDDDGFSTGTAQTLQEFTLTGEYKIPAGLIARVEFRTDFSDEEFFPKDSGSFEKSQPTVLIGLIYAFSNK